MKTNYIFNLSNFSCNKFTASIKSNWICGFASLVPLLSLIL